MTRKELLDADTCVHMFTASGNPVCCMAALENVSIVEEEQLMENAVKAGAYFLERLEELKQRHE